MPFIPMEQLSFFQIWWIPTCNQYPTVPIIMVSVPTLDCVTAKLVFVTVLMDSSVQDANECNALDTQLNAVVMESVKI